MGIIYNPNVEETKIIEAYGLTVYGKINRYDWTVFKKDPEKCLITIRIEDSKKDIFSMNMGNMPIMWGRVDDTMENFLYWIHKENPSEYDIENKVYQVLCRADCIFNDIIRNRRNKEQREAEERKRQAEQQEREEKNCAAIETYCKEHGFFFFIGYEDAVIIKALTNESRSLLAKAQKQPERMSGYIEYMEKYPDNNDARIVERGTMEQILQHIERNDRK